MTKRIRKVSELPEWFDLANYSEAQSLDAAGWYEQLHVRRQLRCDVILRKNHPEYPVDEKTLSELLTLVRANPIVDITTHPRLRDYFFHGDLEELKTHEPFYSQSVRPITVDNLYWMEHLIEKEKREYAREFYRSSSKNGSMPTFLPENWMIQPVDRYIRNNFDANIRVNLSVQDEQLIEGFKQFLKSVRAKNEFGSPMKQRVKPNFSEWRRLGVLPYLDLKIWQHEFSRKIPNRVLADAVFPPGEGGEEVIRKTTARLARQLLGSSYMESLMSLAACEILERKT